MCCFWHILSVFLLSLFCMTNSEIEDMNYKDLKTLYPKILQNLIDKNKENLLLSQKLSVLESYIKLQDVYKRARENLLRKLQRDKSKRLFLLIKDSENNYSVSTNLKDNLDELDIKHEFRRRGGRNKHQEKKPPAVCYESGYCRDFCRLGCNDTMLKVCRRFVCSKNQVEQMTEKCQEQCALDPIVPKVEI